VSLLVGLGERCFVDRQAQAVIWHCIAGVWASRSTGLNSFAEHSVV
jgi:hypothetical protein